MALFQRREQGRHDVRYRVSHNDAEGDHTAKSANSVSIRTCQIRDRDELQSPLSDGDGDETGLSIAMLDCCLEGVGAAKFGIYDDEADCPINSNSQEDEQDDTCKQTGLAKCIWLSDDSGTTARTGQIGDSRG